MTKEFATGGYISNPELVGWEHIGCLTPMDILIRRSELDAAVAEVMAQNKRTLEILEENGD